MAARRAGVLHAALSWQAYGQWSETYLTLRCRAMPAQAAHRVRFANEAGDERITGQLVELARRSVLRDHCTIHDDGRSETAIASDWSCVT